MNYYHTPPEHDFLLCEPDSLYDGSKAVCMDLLTDFGFKHIFGKESHKDILVTFLNVLFQGRKVIKDLQYNNSEQLGPTDSYRTVHFDLICTGDNGEQFIIEMQRASQKFYVDRCLFYNARLLIDQAPRSGKDWSYDLKGVFSISILEEQSKQLDTGAHFITPVELVNRNTHETFSDKTGYIFLELSKFDKGIEDLATDLDRWCYVLKHLHQFKQLPRYLNQEVFQRIFKLAQVAQLPKEDLHMYDRTLKAKRDWNNMLSYAKEQAKESGKMEGIDIGVVKGKEERNVEIAIAMLNKGMDMNSISEITQLSIDEIQKLMHK